MNRLGLLYGIGDASGKVYFSPEQAKQLACRILRELASWPDVTPGYVGGPD